MLVPSLERRLELADLMRLPWTISRGLSVRARLRGLGVDLYRRVTAGVRLGALEADEARLAHPSAVPDLAGAIGCPDLELDQQHARFTWEVGHRSLLAGGEHLSGAHRA